MGFQTHIHLGYAGGSRARCPVRHFSLGIFLWRRPFPLGRPGPEGKVKNEKSAVPTCRCSFDSSRCAEHANLTQVGSIRTPRPSNISGTTCGFQGKLLSNLGENASQSPFSSHFLSSCVHVPHIRGRFPDSEHCPSCHLPVQAAICPHTATLSSQPAADSCKTCSFSRFPSKLPCTANCKGNVSKEPFVGLDDDDFACSWTDHVWDEMRMR